MKWARSRTYLAKIKIHIFSVVAKEFFNKLFEKNGCLMIVDVSNDEKIHPQGLKDYVFLK